MRVIWTCAPAQVRAVPKLYLRNLGSVFDVEHGIMMRLRMEFDNLHEIVSCVPVVHNEAPYSQLIRVDDGHKWSSLSPVSVSALLNLGIPKAYQKIIKLLLIG